MRDHKCRISPWIQRHKFTKLVWSQHMVISLLRHRKCCFLLLLFCIMCLKYIGSRLWKNVLECHRLFLMWNRAHGYTCRIISIHIKLGDEFLGKDGLDKWNQNTALTSCFAIVAYFIVQDMRGWEVLWNLLENHKTYLFVF